MTKSILAAELVEDSIDIKDPALTTQNAFDVIPTSPATHLINKSLIALATSNDMRTNRNTKITLSEMSGGSLRVKSENKTNEIELLISNYCELTKGNKGTKKCFAFLMAKYNESHYGNTVSFPLRDMVNLGIYSSVSNASRGLRESVMRIGNITFSGTSKVGKNVVTESNGRLCYHVRISNGYATVYFNDQINIDFLARYYTILPHFAYSLSTHAFSLVEYIFYRARQETRSIAKNGCFNISLKSIRDYLNLPHEDDTQRHSDYIKKPLSDAISEVVRESNDCDFSIEKHFTESKNVREWLDGYITVELRGDIAENFKRVSKKAEKAITKKT